MLSSRPSTTSVKTAEYRTRAQKMNEARTRRFAPDVHDQHVDYEKLQDIVDIIAIIYVLCDIALLFENVVRGEVKSFNQL